MGIEKYISALTAGPFFRFSDGLDPSLPLAEIGAYAIWKWNVLLYVGSSGRAWKADPAPARMRGIKDRLDSHWKGKRSGSTLALAVWDRYIVPSLSMEETKQLADGRLMPNPDERTREFICSNLSYSFICVCRYSEALKIENELRLGKTAAGTPLLNPKRTAY